MCLCVLVKADHSGLQSQKKMKGAEAAETLIAICMNKVNLNVKSRE